jgi:catechol-2,3-dioxygenase
LVARVDEAVREDEKRRVGAKIQRERESDLAVVGSASEVVVEALLVGDGNGWGVTRIRDTHCDCTIESRWAERMLASEGLAGTEVLAGAESWESDSRHL